MDYIIGEKKIKSIVINGDTAIKPYYYVRNGILHARYTVDRAVELTESEEVKVKAELTQDVVHKQDILARWWNLLTVMVGRAVLHDGIRAAEDKMYGHKN